MTRKHKDSKRQSGFFDLGLSLMILALSGGVVLTINHVENEKLEAAQERASMQANQALPSVKTANVSPSDFIQHHR